MRIRHRCIVTMALTGLMGFGPLAMTPAAAAATAIPHTIMPAAVWQPTPGTTWQWQLVGRVDPTTPGVQMFDLDLFDARPGQINAGAIDALHARGIVAICYLDTGAWESYRPDASRFPRSVIGNQTYASNGSPWKGEHWLDIRRSAWPRFAHIIWDRLDLAVRDHPTLLAGEGDQIAFARSRRHAGQQRDAR